MIVAGIALFGGREVLRETCVARNYSLGRTTELDGWLAGWMDAGSTERLEAEANATAGREHGT